MPNSELEEGDGEGDDLRGNFKCFAILFAINHAVVTTPLIVSSSVLAPDAAYMGGALLMVFTIISSLCLAAPAVASSGLRAAVMFGMGLYLAYIGAFTVAIILGKEMASLQYAVFCSGSICGGSAAGILWTSQGGYFARTTELLVASQTDKGNRTGLSAELAAQFAFYYLGFEVAAKLLWALLDYLAWKRWLIGCIFFAIGLAAMVRMGHVRDLGDSAADPGRPPSKWFDKLQVCASLWKDPVVFLLSGINLTFGFSAAFMNGYVNAEFTAKQLGTAAVPFLAAATSIFAAILSQLFGYLSASVGKGPVVFIGSLSFLSIALCFKMLGCCENWGAALVVLYMLQGTGRAVYESTNKGIFLDFFPSEPVGAFANCMLQNSLAFGVSFFLSGVLQGPQLATLVLILAVLTPLACGTAYAVYGDRVQPEGGRLVPRS